MIDILSPSLLFDGLLLFFLNFKITSIVAKLVQQG